MFLLPTPQHTGMYPHGGIGAAEFSLPFGSYLLGMDKHFTDITPSFCERCFKDLAYSLNPRRGISYKFPSYWPMPGFSPPLLLTLDTLVVPLTMEAVLMTGPDPSVQPGAGPSSPR